MPRPQVGSPPKLMRGTPRVIIRINQSLLAVGTKYVRYRGLLTRMTEMPERLGSNNHVNRRMNLLQLGIGLQEAFQPIAFNPCIRKSQIGAVVHLPSASKVIHASTTYYKYFSYYNPVDKVRFVHYINIVQKKLLQVLEHLSGKVQKVRFVLLEELV